MGLKKFFRDTGGDAVVEAAILFPIIIMVFSGLVLLSMYLPARATLQRATQLAVTAIATEKSDTWLSYNENSLQFVTNTNPPNVYAALGQRLFTAQDRYKSETIVINMENRSFVKTPGTLTIECGAVNYLIYKELSITATRSMPSPVDLSFVGFPRVIVVSASSTAVVQDVDGFIRDVDMINDILPYLGWSPGNIGSLFSAVTSLFG
ncbi:MAG: hypothetical protein FWH55_00530 [Oscillospiraceae bacterium]|nr:hypothetical protein [Oscillospiraceae bacterium]